MLTRGYPMFFTLTSTNNISMNKAEFLILLDKYIDGKTTLEEDELLNNYYSSFQNSSSMNDGEAGVDKEELEGKILTKVNRRIDSSSVMTLWYRISGAAAIVVVLGICLYFYSKHKESSISVLDKTKQEQQAIVPGSNKATLTLSDGSIVSLEDASNGRIADQSNITIEKTADGQLAYRPIQAKAATPRPEDGRNVLYNTITTPRGGQYQLTLSDGTKVWLNAGSALKYPTSFFGNERRVELHGEGYFEVSQNKALPFKVTAISRNGNMVNEQQVTVSGTHFNINAYDDESMILTTLLEGLVNVSPKRASGTLSLESADARWVHGISLKPGEQSFVSNNKITVNKPDKEQIETAIAWKNGLFRFNRADLETVMLQLSKWYDIDVTYEGKIPKREFTGKIYRTVSIAEALDILKYIKVKFKMEGRKIIIMS